MGLKNVIAADELGVNKFKFLVNGIIPIFFLEVKGLETEVESATLPDQTTVSGGRKKISTFTGKVPAHHLVEVRALEEWQKQSVDPVDPGYKKSGTLIFQSKTGLKLKAWNIKGCWCSKEKLPDADLKDEGNEAEVEFTFMADDIKAVF